MSSVPPVFVDERLLSRREYDILVAQGVFDGERLELLEGRIVRMSPQKPPHAGSIRALKRAIERALGPELELDVQLPFAALANSEPEPDLAVVSAGNHFDDHPAEALLVVEVSLTTLGKDRLLKSPIYAKSGVPEYWIVNLVEGVVEVHLDPVGEHYSRTYRVGRGATLSSESIPGLEIALDEVLPPA